MSPASWLRHVRHLGCNLRHKPCAVRIDHADGRVTPCIMRRPTEQDRFIGDAAAAPGNSVWMAVVPRGTRMGGQEKVSAGCIPPRTTLVVVRELRRIRLPDGTGTPGCPN